MTFKMKPAHITWALLLKSGPVEIWEGKPRFGSYSQWEVRNTKSGEAHPVDKTTCLQTFDQMVNNQKS